MSNTTSYVSINPATGKEIKRYPEMSWTETEDAIKACHEAFLDWKMRSYEERAEVLKNIGKQLRQHKDQLAKLMTQEMGKILKQGAEEVELCAAICDWTAEHGPDMLQDETRTLPEGGKGIITYSPIGVIYGIQPWNFPAYQVVRYAIANFMTGNGVLLKHAEVVTGSALLLAEIFEKGGLPKNLFKVLLISHEDSDKVIQHELVRGVTFTGSVDVGTEIAKKAAAELKKTVMELGSNDAYIVLEDADLDAAVESCVQGRIYNNGETCVAAKRFVVVDAVFDAFKERFVKAMEALQVGDPTKEDSDLGPLVTKDAQEKLQEQVQKSVDNGAEILCGGRAPEGDGFYYLPTVLGNVRPGQPAYDGELFGPVASLIHAKDQEDALRIANDSRFGLGGAIFSKDEKKATQLAQEHFDTGMVFINGFGVAKPNMPFGGVKDSGYGREHGGFGIKEFANAKAVLLQKE